MMMRLATIAAFLASAGFGSAAKQDDAVSPLPIFTGPRRPCFSLSSVVDLLILLIVVENQRLA
jgi:hypothetical protein